MFSKRRISQENTGNRASLFSNNTKKKKIINSSSFKKDSNVFKVKYGSNLDSPNSISRKDFENNQLGSIFNIGKQNYQ